MASEERPRAVLAAAGLIFGVALVGLIKDRLALDNRYAIGPVSVALGVLPQQLEDHRGRLLAGYPLVAGPRSIFDSALPGDLQRELLQLPWVASVSNLRRRLPDGFRVDVTLRTPVAVVCIGDERLAVDREGVVLESDAEFRPPECPEIHLIGEVVETVPVDGMRFRRASVLEALAVLADLEAPRREGHAAFDSCVLDAVLVGRKGKNRRAGSADIDLLLDNGVQVAWGRSSRSPLHVFELPTSRKLDHLERLCRTYPGLLGIERVDLRFEDPMVWTRS